MRKSIPRMSRNLPSIQSFDRNIHRLGGSTSALEVRKEALHSTKRHRLWSQEQREIDLVKQLSALKRELNFFRPCYEAALALTSNIYTVSQEMYLNYYLRPTTFIGETKNGISDTNWSHLADTEWLNRADELVKHLKDYERTVKQAEGEWIELAQYQCERDRSRWI